MKVGRQVLKELRGDRGGCKMSGYVWSPAGLRILVLGV